MSDIKAVTIQKINLGSVILRKYHVDYYSGDSCTFGVPPETVDKFIKENYREFSKVKYTFKDESRRNSNAND